MYTATLLLLGDTHTLTCQFKGYFPHNLKLLSVLRLCWLDIRKGIQPVKNWVMKWLSVWSKVQMICMWSSWCHCHPIISCFIKILIEAIKRLSVCPSFQITWVNRLHRYTVLRTWCVLVGYALIMMAGWVWSTHA